MGGSTCRGWVRRGRVGIGGLEIEVVEASSSPRLLILLVIGHCGRNGETVGPGRRSGGEA